MPKGMQPIFSRTLTSTNTNINIFNIPQTYTDLQLVMSVRSSGSTGSGSIGAYFSGGTYPSTASWLAAVGNGSSTSSSINSAYQNFGNVNDATHTANTFSTHIIYIPEYTTTKFKQFIVDSVSENNATAAQILMLAGLDRINSPITSITMDMGGNLFQIGTTMTLYGISR
jgi:hypothetical protein